MDAREWDWSQHVVDHLDLHAGDCAGSAASWATVPHFPRIPDGNNVEALYRDVGAVGHEG